MILRKFVHHYDQILEVTYYLISHLKLSKSIAPASCKPDTMFWLPTFKRNHLMIHIYSTIPYVLYPYQPGVVTEPEVK